MDMATYLRPHVGSLVRDLLSKSNACFVIRCMFGFGFNMGWSYGCRLGAGGRSKVKGCVAMDSNIPPLWIIAKATNLAVLQEKRIQLIFEIVHFSSLMRHGGDGRCTHKCTSHKAANRSGTYGLLYTAAQYRPARAPRCGCSSPPRRPRQDCRRTWPS